VAKEFDAVAESTQGLKPRTAGNLAISRGPEGDLCMCGCGQHPSSKKGTFIPGHDQRLKGKLGRAKAAGAKVELHIGKDVRVLDPQALADERKWKLPKPGEPAVARKSSAKSSAKKSTRKSPAKRTTRAA
jgi:hypothetical protein